MVICLPALIDLLGGVPVSCLPGVLSFCLCVGLLFVVALSWTVFLLVLSRGSLWLPPLSAHRPPAGLGGFVTCVKYSVLIVILRYLVFIAIIKCSVCDCEA